MDNKKKLEGLTTDQYAGSMKTSADNYYDLAKEQEYGLLFDKEVQLENARANAQKYTQNQINAQGMGGTGYGQTLQSGIYNNYINQVNQAKQQTAQNINDINLQQIEANKNDANDRFQSVTTMLMQASNVDQMNDLLTDYGYGSVGGDGEFHWNEQKPEGMSDDDWYQIRYYYGLQKDGLAGINNPEGVGSLFEISDDAKYVGYKKDGTTFTLTGDWIRNESNELKTKIENGTIQKGTYVELTNGHEESMYVYYAEDGKVYLTNPSAYNKATKKLHIGHEKK